ncbi:MAG: pilus assembly protein [Alphaproteobacteria bacterium]|nr:pilus assembly protein [Alphaproteobacteria bacterium]
MMISPPFFSELTRQRARAAARRFARDRNGAAAVEFAMVATPFFMLLFGILEIALVFFASAIIEDGVAEASRDIRTGQFQNSGLNEDDFRAAICQRIDVVADCGRLRVDVRTFDNFSSSQFGTPRGGNGDLDDSGFTFEPGDAGDVVVVRVFYDWPLLGPGFINGLSNLPGNRRLISSATAFRNEPFRED